MIPITSSRQLYLIIALQILFGIQMGGHSEADVLTKELSSSQIKLGSRVFDFRADVRKLRPSESYAPYVKVNEVDWLRDFLESLPETKNVVFEIVRLNHPVLDHWAPLRDLSSLPIVSGFPEAYQVDGYLTFANSVNFRDVLLFKKEFASDFYIRCGGSNPSFSVYCGLRATYPPDPTIQLVGHIYAPSKPYRFEQVANILRRVAYCLDVTDRRDIVPPRSPNPRLLDEDCKFLPSS
ncbi:hypothetical protein [Litoreibacter halocynthiae]|uniref:hypothetical protein n=1 Tax=Litoreibacter halocynthiae TaxID=1242689 RepID=UPI00249083D6|nr:hypothetical protein [Litoreibacter halocynthiae]